MDKSVISTLAKDQRVEVSSPVEHWPMNALKVTPKDLPSPMTFTKEVATSSGIFTRVMSAPVLACEKTATILFSHWHELEQPCKYFI